MSQGDMGQASEWRIAVKGEQRGPYTLDQLRAMIADGRLPADTLVWRPGMANWTPMGSVPELAAPVSRGPMPSASAGPIAAAPVAATSGPTPGPSALVEFLAFRQMLTPSLIKILFWLGIVGCGLMALSQLIAAVGFRSFEMLFMAIGTLLIGPLVVRVYCELIIVFFRIYETLQEIKEQRK